MEPTEQLHEGCCGVHEDYTHRGDGITPLDLAVIRAARVTAYILKCRGEWRNMGLGYLKIEFLQEYPLTLKRDRILKKYQFVQQYKVLILGKTGVYKVKLPTSM